MKEKKNGGRLGEVLRFLVTGGVCTLLEWGLFYVLSTVLGLNATWVATPVSYLISLCVNYLLCVRWVFEGARGGGAAAKAGFLVTSLIGFALNWLLMIAFGLLWDQRRVLFTLVLTVDMGMVSKVLATLLVLVWNYFTKRAVLSSDLMARLTARLKAGRDDA